MDAEAPSPSTGQNGVLNTKQTKETKKFRFAFVIFITFCAQFGLFKGLTGYD